MREGLDDLDQALDQDIDPAAVIAGDAADDDAEGEADGDADQPDGQRDARAVEDAREQVATEPVGAEQEERALLGRTGEVEIALDEAPELIAVAVAEESDRLWLAGILGVDAPQVAHVEPIIVTVDEGPDEMPVVKEMDALRRREDEVGMARLIVVGRQDLADRDRQIHRQEDGAG